MSRYRGDAAAAPVTVLSATEQDLLAAPEPWGESPSAQVGWLHVTPGNGGDALSAPARPWAWCSPQDPNPSPFLLLVLAKREPGQS